MLDAAYIKWQVSDLPFAKNVAIVLTIAFKNGII